MITHRQNKSNMILDTPELSNLQYTSFVNDTRGLENLYPNFTGGNIGVALKPKNKCNNPECGCNKRGKTYICTTRSNIKHQNFATGGNMDFEVENTSNLTGLGYDVNLDNELYTNADGSLTGAEVQEVWRNSGTTLSLTDWLKTDSSKQALAYQLQLKTHPEGTLSGRTIKKLYKESGSKLPIEEWVKTDAAKGAMASYAHKQSGSKQTFGDWLKSDTGQQVLSNATLLTALALESKNAGTGAGTGVEKTEQPQTPPPATSGQTTILGMSPLTFGIVAIVGLAVVGIAINKKLK